MKRALTSGLVTFGVVLGTALVAASCAEGEGSAVDAPETLPADAAAEASCGPCAAGEKCSAGACVAVTTDADRDGVVLALDCDDHDPAVNPGAAETCNGKDDNCNGRIDEPFDLDGDGVPTCAVASKAADCDDKDPAVHPGAAETCNGKDDDCNGTVDEGFDKDNDGFYSCARGTIPLDCDDADRAINPNATESCNGKDDDCDGKTDELPATLAGSLANPVNAHWQTAGSALIANGWAQLTQDSPGQAGALWWNGSYVFDTFDVSATFWIQAKPGGADGLAFAWIAGSNLAAVGYGPTYGAGSLPGYAVAIDTFQNENEPPAPFLVILDAAGPTTLLRTAIPNVRDAQNHRLRVRGEGGKVSVWLDGTNVVLDYALPNATAFTGHWGFTGGTGGASEAHWVTDVTMSFPNGQGCVP